MRTTASSTRLNKRRDCTYILFIGCALFLVQPAFAFDTNHHRAGNRIMVLEAPRYERSDYEDRATRRVREQLIHELHSHGFDAQDARMTFDDLQRNGGPDADLFVEVAPAESSERSVADGTVRVPGGAVDIAVVVARVAAELRVYDGRSLNLVTRRHLHSQATTVLPEEIAIGSRRAAIAVGRPILDYARYRAAVNGVVSDAVNEISSLRR